MTGSMAAMHGGWSLGLLLLSAFTAVLAADRSPGPPRLLRQEELSVPVEPDALMRQYAALSAMPSVIVTYSLRGTVDNVRGDLGITLANTLDRLEEGEPAPEILEMFKDILLAQGDETLIVRRVDREPGFPSHSLRFDQYIDSKPVIHGALAVTVDAATAVVQGVRALFLPNRGMPREPVLSVVQAAALATKYLQGSLKARSGTVRIAETAPLAYYGVFPDSTRGQLVWVLNVGYRDAQSGNYESEMMWIDAIDGAYVGRESTGSGPDFPVPERSDRGDSTDSNSLPDQAAPGERCQPDRSSVSGGGNALCDLPAPPDLRLEAQDGRSTHEICWAAVPGATTYHAERVPVGYPWGLATTMVDGYFTATVQIVTEPTEVRVRACNGCGCGDWAYAPTLR